MLELRTLGDVAVVAQGRRVRLGTRKQTALLVYLACRRGGTVRRQELVDLLWPNSEPPRARHSLSNALYALRKRLPELRLELHGDDIRMPLEGMRLDVATMDAAMASDRFEEAVALYRGGFLEGFWVDDVPAFTDWQEEERTRLEREARYALRRLLEEVEESGDWPRVERVADRILELDPYDERVHTVRIAAIAALGDPQRARRELARVRATLGAELERDVGPELLALERALTTPRAGSQGDEAIGPEPPTAFTGRRHEFRILRDEWSVVQGGSGRVVVVAGEAGIGKTRLCGHFLRLAALRDGRILSGRCLPTTMQVPFSAVADALSDSVCEEDIAALERPWAELIANLFPSVVPPATDPPDISVWDAKIFRRRVFDAVAHLLRVMSRRSPLVLFLDDMHWADDSTAALVHHLTDALRDQPVMLLLAVRPEDIAGDAALKRFLDGDVQIQELRRLELAELEPAEVHAMIDSYEERTGCSIPPTVRERIFHQTGGRPFFVIEILDAIRSGSLNEEHVVNDIAFRRPGSALLSKSTEAFLRARLREIDKAALHVAGALAVIGRPATIEELAALHDVDANRILVAVEELDRKGIAREVDHAVAFTHDLLRDAAYGLMSGVRRRHLHARAAAMIRRLNHPDHAALAVHYHLAGDRVRAREFALRAAEASTRIHASRESEYFLKLALENAKDPDQERADRERIALFYYHAFQHAEADHHFAILEPIYREANNRRGLLTVEVNRVALQVQQAIISPIEAIKRFDNLVQSASQLEAHDWLAEIMRFLIITAHNTSSQKPVPQALDALFKIVDTVSPTPHTVRALSALANIIAIYRSVEDASILAERSLEMASKMSSPHLLAIALRARGLCQFYKGEIQASERNLVRSCDIAATSILGTLTDSQMALAVLYMESGDYSAAMVLLERIIKSATDTDDRYVHIAALSNRMLLNFERGDHSSARAEASELLERIGASGHWWGEVTAWSILGLCALARGAVGEAQRYRREVETRFDGQDYGAPDLSYVEMLIARLAVVEGQHEAALARLDRAIEAYAERDVFCRSRLRLERARTLSRLDPERAGREADEVRALGAEIGAPPLVSKAESVLAGLARPGPHGSARNLLDPAGGAR